MDKTENLQRRIAQAAENVTIAERELEAALAVIANVPRDQKQMISARLESAFARLADTRRSLESVLDDSD